MASIVCGHCGGDLSFMNEVQGAHILAGGGNGLTYPADRNDPVLIGEGGSGVKITVGDELLHECGDQSRAGNVRLDITKATGDAVRLRGHERPMRVRYSR